MMNEFSYWLTNCPACFTNMARVLYLHCDKNKRAKRSEIFPATITHKINPKTLFSLL